MKRQIFLFSELVSLYLLSKKAELYYLSNDTMIESFGSKLTAKLGITIKHWDYGGSVQNGRRGGEVT